MNGWMCCAGLPRRAQRCRASINRLARQLLGRVGMWESILALFTSKLSTASNIGNEVTNQRGLGCTLKVPQHAATLACRYSRKAVSMGSLESLNTMLCARHNAEASL